MQKKKIGFDSCLTVFAKIDSEWITDLHVNPNAIKLRDLGDLC